MSKIDYQALREAAEQAIHDDWGYDADIFHEQVTPSVVLALLDEIKHLEDENIDALCRIAELEEALRDKQSLLEVMEKRVAELEKIATDYALKFRKAQDALKYALLMLKNARTE